MRRQSYNRNYLRVRGEYSSPPRNADMTSELPPRARRIRARRRARVREIGTTSACAENTRSNAHNRQGTRNYLRVRGEYFPHVLLRAMGLELPPRARRIHARRGERILLLRTTSACAENTGRCLVLILHGGNYLRVRGEYANQWPAPQNVLELPPRARRIPPSKHQDVTCAGTTSACAENT